MVDGALVNGGPAECLVADRFGALAGVGGVQRGAALEKQPVSRIERLGGEMGDTIFVDITPQVGPRRASAAESKNSGQSHDDFAGGARIARGHGHRWNEAN